MNIKNLITCGCSFSEGHKLSKKFLPQEITWGEFVAKKKNWTHHNLAMGGMGNYWISQQVIAFLENNENLKNNSIVMVGWSDMGRQLHTFQPSSNHRIKLITVTPADFQTDNLKNHWTTDTNEYHGYALKYGKTLYPFFSSYAYCFLKTYQSIFNLKTYLKQNQIPFIFFDALGENKIIQFKQVAEENLFRLEYKDSYGSADFVEELIDDSKLILNYLNPSFNDKLFDTNFITFNGHTMLTAMRGPNYNFYTSGNEGHPNQHACEYFSDLIIKSYQKLYEVNKT